MKALKVFPIAIVLTILGLNYSTVNGQQKQAINIAFYNMENLFDTIDTPNKIDEEYLTLIFVSHQIENIKDVCKKIVILERGEVKFAGGLDDGIKIYNNSLT